MTTTFRIEGLKELEAAFEELGDVNVRKASARRALRRAAQPIADDAQGLAPVDTGSLAKSIRVGAAMDAGRQAFGEVLRAGGSREQAVAAMRDIRRSASAVQISIGPGRHPQAIFQEFGTEHHPPQPFMRPAWDSNKDRAVELIKKELWADIDKTAKRAANKAARLAKKAARLDANADLLRAGIGGE